MSTRSMIAFDNGDDIYAIYCHFDGYPSGVGNILLNNYEDIEKVEELMDLGDLSILDEEIGAKQDFNNRTKGWCLAYGRDRGEKDTEAKVFGTLDEAADYYNGCDYFYMFDGHSWLYKRQSSKNWEELTLEGVK